MRNPVQYRWSVKTENVYQFCLFNYSCTLSSYKNEVSGFVMKHRVMEFLKDLYNHTNAWHSLKLVEVNRYWKSYDAYQEGYADMKPGLNQHCKNILDSVKFKKEVS